MYSDRSGIKLETSNRKLSGKPTNMWKLNNMFLNNLSQEKLKHETYFELSENENTTYQNVCREIYIIKSIN